MMIKSFQALAKNIFESTRQRSGAAAQVQKSRRQRTLDNCFTSWSDMIEKKQTKNKLSLSLE